MALLYLIQKGEAARAASLIYLVPPVSAVMAWLGFNEPIGWPLIAGFAITALGVAMVQTSDVGGQMSDDRFKRSCDL